MSRTIFFIGATGFVGGTVLSILIRQFKQLQMEVNFRILVRTPEKGKRVLQWAKGRNYDNIELVFGTLDNSDLLTRESSNATIVINAASADHLQSVKDIVNGLLISKAHPLYLHTSGTNFLSDDARGEFTSDHIYSEDDVETLPLTNPHRDVDDFLLKQFRSNTSKFDLMIIAPSTVWGVGSGPDNVLSDQIPYLTRNAVGHRQVYVRGKGKSIRTHVHVIDLAEFYALAVKKYFETPGGHTGLFLAVTEEYNVGEVSQQIQNALFDLGLASSAELKYVSDDGDWLRVYPDAAKDISSNGRSITVRAAALGWVPTRSTTERFFASSYEGVFHYVAGTSLAA